MRSHHHNNPSAINSNIQQWRPFICLHLQVAVKGQNVVIIIHLGLHPRINEDGDIIQSRLIFCITATENFDVSPGAGGFNPK